MQPLPHQALKAIEVFDVLRKYKFCLLQGEVRSGKTLTALLAIAKSKSITRILILTKKQAIPGINKFINDPELQQYWTHQTHTVTNYEAIGRFITRTESKQGKPIKPVSEPHLKLNPDDYDLIICDEVHVLGKLGKPSQRYKLLKLLAQDKPWLAMSGTTFVESPNQIYYETSFSTKTPFPQPNFYKYFAEWGIPSELQIGRDDFVKSYKLAKPELLKYIDTFSVKLTQKDAGIKVQSQDVLHFIKPSSETATLYNQLQTDRIITLPTGHDIVADSILALRLQLHQIEGGTIKCQDEYINLNIYDKIKFIKDKWGDTKDIGIMAYYKQEAKLLEEHFQHAQIYSSIRHAEGVDLSKLHHFVIYSFGFSGAKFIQFRDRITNVGGSNTTDINLLLTKGGISHQAYKAVSEKKDFNNSLYKQTTIG